MATLEVFGILPSTYTRAIVMACEEKGVDYKLTPAPPHSPPAAAISPVGRIPGIRHGDFELCETNAIALYLDRVFPGPKLIPDDPRVGALTEQWISLVNTPMDQALVRTYVFAYIFPKTPDRSPDRAAIDGVLPTVLQHIETLDQAVAKTGYLAGDQYTFADINLMSILFYLKQLPESGGAIGKAKNLHAYYERHAARPSFKNTIPPPPSQERRE
jgi:glutathione S-transferase